MALRLHMPRLPGRSVMACLLNLHLDGMYTDDRQRFLHLQARNEQRGAGEMPHRVAWDGGEDLAKR